MYQLEVTMERIMEIDSIKYLIYSFGDVGHRKQMAKISHQLYPEDMSDSVVRDYMTYRRTYRYADFPTETLVEFILRTYDLRYRQRSLRNYFACRCCSRHSHYKPYIRTINDGLFEYEERVLNEKPEIPIPESKNHHDCDCKCRHFTRAFFEIQEYPEFYDEYS